MENKQTAVQWLFKNARLNMSVYDWLLCIERAEEMEKQQMQEFYNEGKDFSSYTYDEQHGGVEYWDREPMGFEQFYNETYGK